MRLPENNANKGAVSIAVVILNYMNYQETVTCVDSVLNQKDVEFEIVVVDNASNNESFKVLKQKYASNDLVHVLRARKNYGFAKGNNIGINYARDRFHADFVLVINSDTKMIDEHYISILISHYQENVGVIGSEIILRNGIKQKKYLEYVDFPDTLFCYVNLLNEFLGTHILKNYIEQRMKERRRKEVLHGSAFLLTPSFFEVWDGLCSKTFLYAEEILLYILCRRANLQQVYTSDTRIFHKEDQSSKYLFENRSSIKLKYILNSYKYVVWESFKEYLTIKFSERKGDAK